MELQSRLGPTSRYVLSDLAETIIPMLDDIARAFSCDRGLVAVYDRERRTLRGAAGHEVAAALVDAFEVRLDGPLATAFDRGDPLRIDDIARDARLGEPTKLLLLEAGFQKTAIVPVSGPEGPAMGVVVLSRRATFTQGELRALKVVTDRARDVLARAKDAAELRDIGDAAAVEMEWLRSAIDAVDDPVVVTDEQNEIVLRNSRAEALFRAHDDDTEGRRHAVWMNNFLFTAALSSWKLEPAGPAGSREATLVDPIEGSEIVFEVIARPVMNYRDATRGTVSVLKDVTELRHVTEELVRGQQQLDAAGEAIRVERDRLELILRSAPNPIVVLGAADDPITMNPAAERLFATGDRASPVSDRRRQIALANETRFTSFVSQLRLEPGLRKTGELALSDPDTGEPLQMAVTAGEIRDDVGAAAGFVAVLQDIGRLRELARLQQQDELKTQFLSIASHELRTPTTAVSGFAQLALRRLRARLAEGPPPDAAWAEEIERLVRQLTVIHDQSGRLGRLVRELLDVSRIQAGRIDFDMRPVDLGALVRAVAEQVQLVSPQYRFDVATEDRPVMVEGDRDHLEQVIANLIDNAVKYSREGAQIEIRVSRSDSAERSGEADAPKAGEARVDVNDHGIGIPAAQLGRIFDLFYRTDAAEAQRLPGLGLGLFIARAIVERHGGRIAVESVEGQGTTVRVALPLLAGTALADIRTKVTSV